MQMENIRDRRVDADSLFGETEALRLHQLRLLEWMVTTGRKRFVDEPQPAVRDKPAAIPDTWNLTKGVEPHAWQHQCIAKWLKKRGRGTVKVVTGAGKTLLALFIAELVQNTEDKDLHLGIVVPTIVLMHQWYDAILEHGNVPAEGIGRLGGGYDEGLGGGKRILISVLASASERLPKLVKEANVEEHLLLVADECHHAGASEMSKVLKTKCRWSLGLSATPERDDDDDLGYNESLLGKKLGPIIYEFNLADALREGLVPKFTINHYGLSMTVNERQRYEALSRSITDAMSKLKVQRDSRSDGDFFSWARSVASRNQGDIGTIAMRFISDVSKRRELLSHLEARRDAVIQLIEQEFRINPDARVILFHESITDVMDLFARLWQRGLQAIAEHSELPASYRETGLDYFRKGIARIIVSARSLIEGFNVPAVDVGIIVASSGSVRQRIQSLGRMLRRHRGLNGEEKTSCIHVLYAADSSEENIYGKVDWYEATGVDSNKFYLWDVETEPRSQNGPPRTPLPTEEQIDSDSLEAGARYPGQYEGAELSCDSQRNITNADGQYAVDTTDVAEAVLKIKGSGGKFRVTSKRHFVLVRVPSDEEWETLYVTQLAKPLRFDAPTQKAGSREEAMKWAGSAQTGDRYPFAGLPMIDGGLRFKQKSGGVISKKVRGGEVFARSGEKAEDASKGIDALRLVEAIKYLQKVGKRVTRIEINEARHALYREAGQLNFICVLQKGLEFPDAQQYGGVIG
jgi:superfamily II DNA or RNA helicase